jgi:hypothetical protein
LPGTTSEKVVYPLPGMKYSTFRKKRKLVNNAKLIAKSQQCNSYNKLCAPN